MSYQQHHPIDPSLLPPGQQHHPWARSNNHHSSNSPHPHQLYDLPSSTADDPNGVGVDVVGLQALGEGAFLDSHDGLVDDLSAGGQGSQGQQPQGHHDDDGGLKGDDGTDDGQHGQGQSATDDMGEYGLGKDGRGSKKRKRAPNGQGVRTIARKQAEDAASYINTTLGRATAFKNGIATIEHNMRLLETKTGAMIFYIAALPDEPAGGAASGQNWIHHTSPSLLAPVPPGFYTTPTGAPLYTEGPEPQQPSQAVQDALQTLVLSIQGLQARWRSHHPTDPPPKKGRPPLAGNRNANGNNGNPSGSDNNRNLGDHMQGSQDGSMGVNVGGGQQEDPMGDIQQPSDGQEYLNHLGHLGHHVQHSNADLHELAQHLSQPGGSYSSHDLQHHMPSQPSDGPHGGTMHDDGLLQLPPPPHTMDVGDGSGGQDDRLSLSRDRADFEREKGAWHASHGEDGGQAGVGGSSGEVDPDLDGNVSGGNGVSFGDKGDEDGGDVLAMHGGGPGEDDNILENGFDVGSSV